MNDVAVLLTEMAERGSSRGAAALLDDIRRDLSGGISVVQPVSDERSRRLRGPLLGAAVAVVVLVVGIASGLFTSPVTQVSPSGIRWERMAIAVGLRAPAAGPGGFISFGTSPQDDVSGFGLWRSDRGVEWTRTGPTDMSGVSFFEVVVATDDRWLVGGEAEDGSMAAWWSDDGESWVPVEWPASIADTLSGVSATQDWFFAVSTDVFGEGTTMWRSRDGEVWDQLPVGDIDPAQAEGTAGGLVVRDGDRISVSTDGTSWMSARVTPPDDLEATRVSVETVAWAEDRWLSIARVERVGQPPVLGVFSSADGESWSYTGVPPFGEPTDRAPTVDADAVIDDRLVVSPGTAPISVGDEGTVSPSGIVSSAREIWSTTDGANWVLELETDRDVLALAGGGTPDGPVGLWYGPQETPGSTSTDDTNPVVTTMALPPNRELDQDGLDYQADAAEDGEITREEFDGALQGWKECMEERGVTDVRYEIDPSGGWSSEYASPSPYGDRENAIDNLCQVSWVEEVSLILNN